MPARPLAVELERIDLARGGRRVLRQINWSIKPGQRWALLGHNGAGKTQLLKLISGDVWPAPTRHGARTYIVGRERHSQPVEIKELIAYIGAERQDKYSRYGWNLTVEDLVGTGLFHTDIVLNRLSATQRARIKGLLRRFGLEKLARRRMLTLSYGERRLALIARALAARPRLLLLDEVFNGLDARRRAALMHWLERTRTTRTPWVLSAHRVEDLPRSTTHVLVLERGGVRYCGPRRGARLNRATMAARVDAPKQQRTVRVRHASPLLSVDAADVYVDHVPILKDLSWQLRAGEHWAVVGANGAGKSTFIRLLHGDLSPALGARLVRRGHPAGTPIEDFKRRVGLLSAELQMDYAAEDVSVEDIVISGRHASIGLNDPATPADRAAARAALRRFGLVALAQRRAREISYGELRRVLLARAMVNRPRLLLLDEPFTGLDAGTRALMRVTLERLARSHVQLVMATHHRSDLVPSINRVLTLADGRIAGVAERA